MTRSLRSSLIATVCLLLAVGAAAQTTTAGPSERVGLSGMDERVRLLGGRLQIRSRPGGGTRVIADVALRHSPRGPGVE